MEKESRPLKLIAAVSTDYPEAAEILVSFPNDWEMVRPIKHGNASFYLAAMPESQEQPWKDEFYGLPAEINLQLSRYRMYRLFEPWPMPSLIVSWDDAIGQGRVKGEGDLKIQLNLLGQAQVWFGQSVAVLWECYLNKPAMVRHGQELIYPFWSAVEDHMATAKIFTQPREPTWEDGYIDFLKNMGYAPDPDHTGWWSKVSEVIEGK